MLRRSGSDRAVGPRPEAAGGAATTRRRPDLLLIVIVVAAVIGATVLVYSPAATWLSDYNQGLIVDQYQDDVHGADPGAAAQLAEAHRYNAALSAGALVGAGEHVPTSDAEAAAGFDYDRILRTRTGVMSRIQIPSIAVDLPVYHGTDDATLLRGAGHLEGTSLPVGGASTHAVITAHRGLADAVMFTDLDRLREGDRFTVTTFGEVLTYEVVDITVVAPSDTLALRQEAGRDLVTLVTCTPLGINSHRILVTGERVTPTPPASTRAAEAGAEGAGFPWWLLAYVGALLLIGVYAWRSSASGARARGGRGDRRAEGYVSHVGA
ncbi:class C sortase [Microbacterium sp. NPDC087591]|uniref:class C sortase n=1 Tax=Microbacterium sp. NPDC087591 TaxID=3364192 RepID=UPI0037F2A3D4